MKCIKMLNKVSDSVLSKTKLITQPIFIAITSEIKFWSC